MDSGINVLTIKDRAYPSLLKEIADPPQQLFYRGNIHILSEKYLLAVVGSRKANAYGRQCVELLLPPIVEAGMILVSGLAYGIDSMAHRACVDQRRPTIAVLGSGIDDESIYPSHHVSLAHTIIEHGGVVISEYEPGSAGYKSNFPTRNRIIAGLCKATLIVQASNRSGTLITGRLALESNRDVLCVPGSIMDPLSKGTNMLIAHGAAPITCPTNILHIYGINTVEHAQPVSTENLNGLQRTLIDVLSHTPQHIDDIIEATALPAHEVSASLAELELSGYVTNVGGMKYVKKM